MGVPLLLHTATISRKQKIEGKGVSSAYQVLTTGVKCLVIPQSEDYNITKDYVYGQDYVAIFDTGTNIRKGDKILSSTGVELLVSGVADYKDVPLVAHMEANCTTEGV